MGSLGPIHWIIVAVVVLLLFGGRGKLSGIMGDAAKVVSPFGARGGNTGIADARVAQAEAGSRAAQAHFDGVVLNALRETETALNLYARELDRRAALQAARDQSAEVAQQARQLYQRGKTGYLEALDAERNLAASEAALAASQALLVDEQVQLFLALGGGWQP